MGVVKLPVDRNAAVAFPIVSTRWTTHVSSLPFLLPIENFPYWKYKKRNGEYSMYHPGTCKKCTNVRSSEAVPQGKDTTKFNPTVPHQFT
jgi:hypothetical protein